MHLKDPLLVMICSAASRIEANLHDTIFVSQYFSNSLIIQIWISDEKLLIFASLISPSKMILFEKKYQTFDTVFHHQMKHLEVRQKYSAARCIFNSLLGVSSGDETLHLMFDILLDKMKF